VTISANGGRVLMTRDVANVVMDLNDVETISFNALGGADVITVNDLSGTDLDKIAINLAGFGGAGDGQVDRIVINATSGDDSISVIQENGVLKVIGLGAVIEIAGFEAHDQLVINGLAGNDIIDASTLGDVIDLIVDAGAGDDIAIGGAGGDVFAGGAGDDVLLGGDGADVLDGGLGEDVLIGGLGLDVLLNGEIQINGLTQFAGLQQSDLFV
jgi:Ca2+-binding RTX toxin-like protein